MKEKLTEHIQSKYNRDKRWCIDYHNKGDVAMYNMIFGRLQSLVIIDFEMKLELGLEDDMIKNIPWNKKMLAAYYTNIVEYSSEDIDNFKIE